MEKTWILHPIAREQEIIAVVMTNAVIQTEDINNLFVILSNNLVYLSTYGTSAG